MSFVSFDSRNKRIAITINENQILNKGNQYAKDAT